MGKAHVKSIDDKFERIEMRAPLLIDGSFTGIRVHDARQRWRHSGSDRSMDHARITNVVEATYHILPTQPAY
jgi:hypothetical protein